MQDLIILKIKASSLASVGLTINRAVLLALWEGRFLLSSPALQDFFFSNGKRKKKKRNDLTIS
jgi:hypothetical protein